jgi:serine/threonine-protein kinase SRPK3
MQNSDMQNSDMQNSDMQNSDMQNSDTQNSSNYQESLSDDDIQDHTANLDLEGKILSKYNILHKLGTGMYSIVWLSYNIENQKFYAIKVQHPDEYNDGLDEIKFMKRLPNDYNFNNLIEYFIEVTDNKKYLCSVYNLHSCNLDCLIRKGNYNNGIPFDQSIKIIKELFKSIYYLHKKLKVCHADIKTDNILVKGTTKLNNYLIDLYKLENFNEKYTNLKTNYCLKNNKKLDNITSKEKKNLRSFTHLEIYKNIIDKYNNYEIEKYHIDYNDLSISLADFGSFLDEDQHYESSFGTRYYRSPENILVGKSSYSNDIWALGCTIYEILSGEILFDPDKDKNYDRDFYHLKLINELCGEFSKDFLKKTSNFKIYFDNNYKIKFDKDLNFKNKIDIKLQGKVPDTIIKLIKDMLIIDPKKRITISECINYLQ